MENIVEVARKHAFKAHEDVNHLYDGKPYKHHLIMAQLAAHKFAYLIPEEDLSDVVAGVLEHDTLEDTDVTYDELKEVTNERVAKLAHACTNNKEGKNRAERANAEYYEKIRNTKYATFVKLCDRIANVLYSLDVENRMLKMYKKEHSHFKSMLYSVEYDDMWNFLDELLTLENLK